MKIYAVRDRLIDYFMQPFIAETDKQVLAGLAATLNTGDTASALRQAPQHFEIWTLGEVDEQTGKITPRLEFLADATSLIRPSVRGAGSSESRNPTDGQAPEGRQRPPDGIGGALHPNQHLPKG